MSLGHCSKKGISSFVKQMSAIYASAIEQRHGHGLQGICFMWMHSTAIPDLAVEYSCTGKMVFYHFTINATIIQELLSTMLFGTCSVQCTSKAKRIDTSQCNTTAEVKPAHKENSLHAA